MTVRRLAGRIALVIGSTALFFGCAELLYRWIGPREPTAADGRDYYADADHVEFDLTRPEDLARAAPLVEVVVGAPRFRMNFRPGTRIHLCYRGREGVAGFDAHGCVPMQINSCGVREREELCEPKRAGERRVVCVGDSMTVGWGVRVEDGWVRRLEKTLRQDDDSIRTVNCGASGALCPDEYLFALQTRFWRFEPDVVLVSLCLNDLLPVNSGMSHVRPDVIAGLADRTTAWWEGSRILRHLARAARLQERLALDPDRDWVGDLLELGEDAFPDWALDMGIPDPGRRRPGGGSKPGVVPGSARAVFWGGGGPQGALRGIRELCAERGVQLGVVLWPFLQGLEDRRNYPFSKMHDLVAAFCADAGIPFLDLLPTFLGRDPATLWVTPADMHANPLGHALATPPIAVFVAGLLGG